MPPSDTDLDAVLTDAQALHEVGEIDRAEALYTQVIGGVDDSGPVYFLRALTRVARDAVEEALDDLAQAARFSPDILDVHLVRAELSAAVGQAEQAKTSVETALALEPDNPDALVLDARLVAVEQRWEEAQSRFEKALVYSGLSDTVKTAYAQFYLDWALSLGVPEAEQAEVLLNQALEWCADDPAREAVEAVKASCKEGLHFLDFYDLNGAFDASIGDLIDRYDTTTALLDTFDLVHLTETRLQDVVAESSVQPPERGDDVKIALHYLDLEPERYATEAPGALDRLGLTEGGIGLLLLGPPDTKSEDLERDLKETSFGSRIDLVVRNAHNFGYGHMGDVPPVILVHLPPGHAKDAKATLATIRDDVKRLWFVSKNRPNEMDVVLLNLGEPETYPWTADYPHFPRQNIQPTIFLTTPGAGASRFAPIFVTLAGHYARKHVGINPFPDAFRHYWLDDSRPAYLPPTKDDVASLRARKREEMDRFKALMVNYGELLEIHPLQTADNVAFMASLPIDVILLVRDPRDIIVSNAMRTTDAKDTGVIPIEEVINQAPALCSLFVAAQAEPRCFIVKFEDIHQRPIETFVDLLIWLDWGDMVRAQELWKSINRGSFYVASGGTMTRGEERSNVVFKGNQSLRKGTTGEWRRYFSDEMKTVFKELTGDALIRLGYEESVDW